MSLAKAKEIYKQRCQEVEKSKRDGVSQKGKLLTILVGGGGRCCGSIVRSLNSLPYT